MCTIKYKKMKIIQVKIQCSCKRIAYTTKRSIGYCVTQISGINMSRWPTPLLAGSSIAVNGWRRRWAVVQRFSITGNWEPAGTGTTGTLEWTTKAILNGSLCFERLLWFRKCSPQAARFGTWPGSCKNSASPPEQT